jgi:hypothetical protein
MGVSKDAEYVISAVEKYLKTDPNFSITSEELATKK